MWDVERADTAPYREIGQGAVNTLGRLMGIQGPEGMTQAPPTVAQTGLVPQGADNLVLMQAPNGAVKQVPASMVDYYLKQGATIIQSGSRTARAPLPAPPPRTWPVPMTGGATPPIPRYRAPGQGALPAGRSLWNFGPGAGGDAGDRRNAGARPGRYAR